jgi:pimeloyl-ACP methyl ester carboxylesterase
VVATGLVGANGTKLYNERRGNGPAVVLVSGATGDACHWKEVADTLSSDHTVVTYDRRGNSRSPRPSGWDATTMDEQADDAVGLIDALDLDRPIVLGTSAAVGIVANLALRHPETVQAVILHEPLFPSGVTDIDTVRARRRALIEEGMARGGPRGATEAFLRSVAGDRVYDSLDPALRERLLANAEVLLQVEMAPYLAYEPTSGEWAALRPGRAVAAGADSRRPDAPGHWRYESARWLAERLATDLIELPGGHMGYLDDPQAFAAALRPVLRRLAGRGRRRGA